MPIRFPDQPERGTTYWDWSLVPVKSEGGATCGLVVSSVEVTDRVKALRDREELHKSLQLHLEQVEEVVTQRTAALQASEARFCTVFEDSVVGMALLDMEGRLVASNRALQRLMGYSEQQLVGTYLNQYCHPDEVEDGRELYASLVAGEIAYYQVEKRYIRKDGQARWGEITVSRKTRTAGDESWFAMATFADITEKKDIQESLAQSERLAIAGRLGVSLAHEINNPLQSVIGCLGLAEEILDEEAEVRRYLEIAIEELERAAAIVRQLRGLGKKPQLRRREPVDLNALVNKVLVLTKKRCQNRRVLVEWQPAADLPLVSQVPDRMQQVFLNVVLNAVEAMPDGGTLVVSTGVVDQHVFVRFSDTGVGIAVEDLSWIFKPFHSIRPESLGLGLYISKTIVEEHDGRIEVDTVPGDGATFTVWLPQ